MAKRYRLILFDCFNTLFLAETSRLPTILVDGKPTPSTAGLLCRHLAELYPPPEEATLHRALREAWRWAEERRGEEQREVPAAERFGRLFQILGLAPPGEERLRRLVETHMAGVTGSYALPAEHRALLERLRGWCRMAIFSNFDYAPALLGLLRQEGIAGWFDPVVVSAAIGYRKPGRAAFQRALALAGEPPEAILLVGDSLADDVAGARAVGMDVAWLNRAGEAAPEALRPTYTLAALAEVEGLLG